MARKNRNVGNNELLGKIARFQRVQLLLFVMTATVCVSMLRGFDARLVEIQRAGAATSDSTKAIARREWSSFARARLIPPCEKGPNGLVASMDGNSYFGPGLNDRDCPGAR
jgi:hypothetical protein